MPRTDHVNEAILVGFRAIPELTIDVITRGPHAAIVLQHHAVVTACGYGLDVACSHGWDDIVNNDNDNHTTTTTINNVLDVVCSHGWDERVSNNDDNKHRRHLLANA